MPKTRSKSTTASKPTPTEEQQADTKKKPLGSVDVPSRTFILPSKRSNAARFLTLENPSTGASSRFFFDPQHGGLYEFTSVASTPWAPSSILFTSERGSEKEGSNEDGGKAYVAKKAELLIATPIDVLFFMLPIIAPSENSSSTRHMFQPLDDILDSQDELAPHLRHILYDVTFRPTLERRMQATCDTMEAGDEKLYRFNQTKLVNELIAKAERMIAQGLPLSLEERFVRTALDSPLMGVTQEEVKTTISTTTNEESQESETLETQSTVTTTVTTMSEEQSGVSTPATQPLSTVDDISSSDSITRLLRLRIALSFMRQSYLPPHLSNSIDELLKSPESPIDFKPLDDRLQELAVLRAEANATFQAAGNYTRKRGLDDEAAESQAEKKRKKEEEEKKKKLSESRGVRDLKKVNTSGMKKMSDFFKKKT